MFSYFETCSRAEREEIAQKLKNLYCQWYVEENTRFIEQRDATPEKRPAAQINYAYAIGKLGAIQAIFEEMGIPFDHYTFDV